MIRVGNSIGNNWFIFTPNVGLSNCSMFCCALLRIYSSFAIISIGKKELVDLLCLSSWFLVIVVWLFLTMPQVSLQFVIVVFPIHTHLLHVIIHLYSYLFRLLITP